MFPLGKVYTGDCVELMQKLPPDYIDLTVTSPPYDNLRKYNGYSFNFEDTATQLYHITKPGGVVVWVVGDATVKGSETGTSFKQALYFMECGFNLHDTMIYNKTGNGSPQKPYTRYSACFEYMFVFSKGKLNAFNPIMMYGEKKGIRLKTKRQQNGTILRGYYQSGNGCPKSNVWKFDASNDTRDSKTHPAPFPETLADDHILSWSNPGDIVFDPFSGSGTTGKMALLNNRKFLGFEISEEYTQLANTRIKNTVFDGL